MPTDTTARGDPGLLWVNGEFWLKVRDAGSERLVHVQRPYGLLGRLEGADVQIDDRSVSARHVYLHLDARGLYAVDLSSRTGTRLPVMGQPAAWLAPGQELEVAGRQIRLLDFRIHQDHAQTSKGRARVDLLAAGDSTLAQVTLYPIPAHETPRSLDSELVFAGRGATCGVRVEGASASRVHAALVRTLTGAYVVDLLGRGTWLNDRAVAGAAPLNDGDTLGLGVARFQVQIAMTVERGTSPFRAPVNTPPTSRPPLAGTKHAPTPSPLVSTAAIAPIPGVSPPKLSDLFGPPDILAADDSQAAALGGLLMRLVHAGQTESLRRQDEFQVNLVRLVHQMQLDNAALLSEHLRRMEAIQYELASLREEIRRRLGPVEAAVRLVLPPASDVPPLRVVAPSHPPADPDTATDWLLTRVNQLEQENRSSWKDLLGRLSGGVRQAP